MSHETISHHYFRRTARRRERKEEQRNPGNQYRVVESSRGPSRFKVVRVLPDPPLPSQARKPTRQRKGKDA